MGGDPGILVLVVTSDSDSHVLGRGKYSNLNGCLSRASISARSSRPGGTPFSAWPSGVIVAVAVFEKIFLARARMTSSPSVEMLEREYLTDPSPSSLNRTPSKPVSGRPESPSILSYMIMSSNTRNRNRIS